MMHTNILTRILCPSLLVILSHQMAVAGTMMGSGDIVAFTMRLSEKEAVLIDPANQKMAMWDNAYQRIADRNMPWLEITNSSESVADITEFLLTLGDNAMDFSFGDVTLDGPILPSDNNPADIGLNASIEQAGDQLRVTFTDFSPDETVRFRIDLEAEDPDAFPHPDFRRVLFDGVPLGTADGTADNARARLRYSNGLILQRQIPEFMVDPFAGMFFEGNLRFAKQLDRVEVFEFGGRIPEPSTWVMAATSLLCAMGWSQRRRSRR